MPTAFAVVTALHSLSERTISVEDARKLMDKLID